jgi:hypothetical protein
MISIILGYGNFRIGVWLEMYLMLSVVSYVVYRSFFKNALYKLYAMNKAIRLGVYIPADIKKHIGEERQYEESVQRGEKPANKNQSSLSVVKINNSALFKSRIYREQVTDKIISHLKNIECCGKKICRVAASYAAFWIDHPRVCIDIILAMQNHTVVCEVFHRRLLQLDRTDCEWLASFFKECLKGANKTPINDVHFISSLCEKIRTVYAVYNDESIACIVIKNALQSFIAKNNNLLAYQRLLKESIRNTILAGNEGGIFIPEHAVGCMLDEV